MVIREIFPEYHGTVGRGKYCFMKRLVYLAAVNVKCGYDLDIPRKIPAEIVMHETDWVFLVMLVVFYPLKKSAGTITHTHNGNLNLLLHFYFSPTRGLLRKVKFSLFYRLKVIQKR
jgi:hypothetical protein